MSYADFFCTFGEYFDDCEFKKLKFKHAWPSRSWQDDSYSMRNKSRLSVEICLESKDNQPTHYLEWDNKTAFWFCYQVIPKMILLQKRVLTHLSLSEQEDDFENVLFETTAQADNFLEKSTYRIGRSDIAGYTPVKTLNVASDVFKGHTSFFLKLELPLNQLANFNGKFITSV